MTHNIVGTAGRHESFRHVLNNYCARRAWPPDSEAATTTTSTARDALCPQTARQLLAPTERGEAGQGGSGVRRRLVGQCPSDWERHVALGAWPLRQRNAGEAILGLRRLGPRVHPMAVGFRAPGRQRKPGMECTNRTTITDQEYTRQRRARA